MNRFPKYCTRCNRYDHFVEDCKMPAADPLAAATHERNAFMRAILVIIVFLCVFGYLERAPAPDAETNVEYSK